MNTDTRVGGDGEVRSEVAPVWPVVLFRGARDNEPKPREWTGDVMVRALAVHRTWTGEKLHAPAWSPVVMVEGAVRRAKKNVAAVSMLVLDCDAGEPLETLEALGSRFYRVGHTSWSHTTGHPKARLVFPFRPGRWCPVAEWGAVWGAAARWAAEHGVTVDAAAKDPSRLYFGPYTSTDIVAREEAIGWAYGPVTNPWTEDKPRPEGYLDWGWLVSNYPEPETDLEDWKVVKSEAGSQFDSNERHDKRRRAFGAGMVRHRAEKLATTGEGGRNGQLFAGARLVGQLERAGAIRAEDALAELGSAAEAAGLSRGEIQRTLRSGYAAGQADGAYDIDGEMGQ